MTFPVAGLIRLEGPGADPLSRQVYRQMRAAVLDGRLPAGARLPSSRELATSLKVSRTTVVAALDQLTLEGFLEPRVGSGTFVAASAEALPSAPATVTNASRAPVRLSARGVALASFVRRESGRGPAFSPGVPDIRLFPHDLWGRLLRAGARRPDPRHCGYGAYDGLPALKRAIAAHLEETRGVRTEPERVLVLSSAQAALDLAARMLVDEGDPVAIENPAYAGALVAFRAARARIEAIPVDGEGLVTAALAGVAPRLVYVSPSHQYPLGMTMSLERRLALLDFAERAGAFVIEDDYDSEFHYRGLPIPALAGLGGSDRVIYLGTFAKTMMPAIRTAFLILPPALVEPFARAQRNTGQVPALAVQAALASFLAEGHLRAHMRRVGQIYRGRRDHLLEALGRRCPHFVVDPVPDGGMQLAARFQNEAVDDRAVAARLLARGIDCAALSAFYLDGDARSGLVLGFAMPNEAEIEAGVGVLEEEIGRVEEIGRAVR